MMEESMKLSNELLILSRKSPSCYHAVENLGTDAVRYGFSELSEGRRGACSAAGAILSGAICPPCWPSKFLREKSGDSRLLLPTATRPPSRSRKTWTLSWMAPIRS